MAREDPGQTTYSPSEAGHWLDLSKRQVLNLLHAGDLAGEKDDHGRWRISAEAVEELRRERESRPAPPRREDTLVDHLREEVEYLRGQLDQEREARTEERRRHDTVLARVTQANADLAARVAEIEGTPETGPEPTESAAGGPGRGTPPETRTEPSPGRLRRLWERLSR